jgi:hypothetical protein
MDPVYVAARDEFGNPFDGFLGDITLRVEGSFATLDGGVAPFRGVAEFTALTIDRPATRIRLIAEATEALPARSDPFDVVAPATPAPHADRAGVPGRPP